MRKLALFSNFQDPRVDCLVARHELSVDLHMAPRAIELMQDFTALSGKKGRLARRTGSALHMYKYVCHRFTPHVLVTRAHLPTLLGSLSSDAPCV